MKIAFVQRGYELLGIEYLSAVLKRAGHEVRLFFEPRLFADELAYVPALARRFAYDSLLVEDVVSWRPDLLAASVMTSDLTWTLTMAGAIQRRTGGTSLVVGGAHVTSATPETMEHPEVAFAVKGYGELPMLELADALAAGRDPAGIANLWWRDGSGAVRHAEMREPFEGAEGLPWPDKDLYGEVNRLFDRDYVTAIGRGCPFRCSFCFHNLLNRLYERRAVWQRDNDDVLAELRFARDVRGARFVRFVDDVFGVERSRTIELLDAYGREIRLPFWALVDPRITDDRLVRALADAGCVEVEVGLQSFDEELRRAVLLRTERNHRTARILDALREAGIRVTSDVMFGLPGERRETWLDLARFLNRHPPTRINNFFLSFLPGVEMVDFALRDGLIEPADVERINRGETLRPFMWGGDTFDREAARYQLLLVLAVLLPAGWIDRLASHAMVRRLPGSMFLNQALMNLGALLKRGTKNTVELRRSLLRYWSYGVPRIVGRRAPAHGGGRGPRAPLRPSPDGPRAARSNDRFSSTRRRTTRVAPAWASSRD